ncbi:hypothetical protein [Allopontixanthobacter sediminis]|uniref:Uncharacterized protein n=1 Tax=Allopontixanthobacter sediminis TaxID=1689985 RepID=A0A845AYX0_9SPHN|nr:hypothetical protein [Allopontixanthobacter sediminis]MXP43064.1 hypothetical protein [Allopontixanthobacter sediminis]
MANAWPSISREGSTNGAPAWGIPAGIAANAAKPYPLMPKARAGEGKRLRLENGPQIRREIVKVYRGMKVGEIDITKGTKLIYALEVLSRAVERENVEKLADRLDGAEGK